MPRYLFSYDQENDSFPERYRVVSPDEDAAQLCAAETLTGTVVDAEAIKFLEEMMGRYQTDDAVTVEFVDAPDWEFIELRFNPAKAEEAEQRPRTP